jgi:ABC-2 type transport system permease protein
MEENIVESVKPEALSRDWDSSFSPIDFLGESFAVVEVEVKKLVRDPTELLSRAIQPILWLVIFGQVFSKVKGIPTGDISYLAFLCPGVMAQSVLFSAIFYGIAVIWERDLGIVHKMLVSPAYRGALVLGKAISAGFRGLVQVIIVYCVAFLMGIEIRMTLPAVLGVFFAVILGSAIFSTFSLIIACLVKTRERFMGIGQVLTMPLFFASNAIYPLALMPAWLQVVAKANPLTYLVDVLRGLMIAGTDSTYGLGFDFGIMAIVFIIMITVASRLYPTLTH